MYYAAKGLGAYLEEPLTTKRLHVSAQTDFSRMSAAMSRSHHSPQVDRINAKLGIPHKIQSGSVGLKVGILAEARAHLYLHLGSKTNQWDTCAPQAILEAAGGVMTDRNGHELLYNTKEVRNLKGVVGSNGVIHERAIDAIKSLYE